MAEFPFNQPPHFQDSDTQPQPRNTAAEPGVPEGSSYPPPGTGSNPEKWAEILKQADRASYQLLAIEVWAIAKTMDTLFPGFWNRFMYNRQIALKQFLQHKQARHPNKQAPSTETGEEVETLDPEPDVDR